MPQKRSVPRVCLQCGIAFLAVPREVKRGGAKYCSPACAGKTPVRTELRQCEICSQPFVFRYHTTPQGKTRFCSVTCSGIAQRKSLDDILVAYEVNQNGCHIYTGSKDRDGYAKVSWSRNGKRIYLRVTRMILERFHGVDIKDPQTVAMHSCDTPACINPAHITPGTNADNTADMVAKGRQTRGEKNRNAKLTEADVRSIRSSYESGKHNQAELAAIWGVNDRNISQIVRRVSWKHVA